MHNKIRIYGDRVLKVKSKLVESTDEVKDIIPQMIEVMKEYNGLGLAAPQIGKPLQLFIVNLGLLEEGKGIKEFLNPKLLYYEGEEIMEEGCLSMPGLYLEIPRPFKVVIEYMDLNLDKNIVEAKGLLARVLLHEYDHINGILIVDRLPENERKIMIAKWRRKWREMKKENSK